jgi:DNA-binding transcriptional MerR regulator
MDNNDMIPAKEFCIHHNIELSFIRSLEESGLIHVVIVEENIYVPCEDMYQLEKMVRFYYEMGINLEGIETINHLLDQMSEMRQEIIDLHNRLQLYE